MGGPRQPRPKSRQVTSTRRRVYINLFVFGLAFVGMIFWAINQIVSVDAVDKPYRLAAEFPYLFLDVGLRVRHAVNFEDEELGEVTVDRVRPGVARKCARKQDP